MANLLRTAFLGGLVWMMAGCQSAMFSAFNAISPGRDIETQAGLVFDDEHDLRADVFLPRTRTTSTPVIVFFYGGSWRSGAREWYRFIGERLASHGFVAVIPDYRKYPEVRFPTFMEDAARAVVWARSEYANEGQPLFVAGHSAGAHVAALVATDGSFLKDAGGSIDQLSGMVGYSGVYDFLPLTDDVLKATFGGEPALWAASQPVNHVDGDEPPFFIVHGRNDRIVWPRNSESLASQLRAHDVPVELLLRDDLGHYASAINFARSSDNEITQALFVFLRNPPPRKQADSVG